MFSVPRMSSVLLRLLQKLLSVELRVTVLDDISIVADQHRHLPIKWKAVGELGGHVEILGFVFLTNIQQHGPDCSLIPFIHAFNTFL